MKKFLICCLLSLNHSAFVNAQPLKISDVVQKVSASNYKVYENALRVYQAKANIEKARADLLPNLNIWSLGSLILDPSSIFDRITDVAPFLVPANWFRLEENKLLYLAEREGYRALWGNEVFTAKSLFRTLLLDQRLYAQVNNSISELERVLKIAKTKEAFGAAKPGTAKVIELRLLGLQEDAENLRLLIEMEYDELTQALGFPASTQLQLVPLEIPNLELQQPVASADYEFRLLATSPERRQFVHFFSVLAQIKNEIEYSILGVSQISRGVAGGVFDHIPIPQGLGGRSASLKILHSQQEILRTQQKGIEETLKRQLRSASSQYNSSIGQFANFKKRVQLAKQNRESLLRRFKLGDSVEVLELYEASAAEIFSETALISAQYRWLESQDRIERLIFTGDYSLSPPLIESLRGASQ
jgi:outer membrane protein TolC